ncbi:MAG TPA: choice-of-anchor P family protein [Pseudonocardia sp.]|nr:choice-of-anchor P family protein [Pseudonocardia sp.]
MNTKKFAGVAAAGAVSAVTTLLLGATPAFAQEDSSTDYAFALEASGVLDINPISFVESADGKLVSDELLSIGDVAGEYEDDISFGLLTAEAESHRAETVVKEVNILNLLRADVIRTWCDNGEGGLQIVNGTILGQEIPDTSVPGEEIDLSPLVKLSLNDQVRHSDGSLTVTGIKLQVLPGAESNSDEQLSAEEKAALPVLGELLGKPLGDGANSVRDVLDQLGGPLALDGDLQSITIGEANCQEGDGDGAGNSNDDGNGNGGDDGGKDDGDDNGNGGDDDGGDDGGNGDGGDDSDVKSAPAPSVVQAALPVTG